MSFLKSLTASLVLVVAVSSCKQSSFSSLSTDPQKRIQEVRKADSSELLAQVIIHEQVLEIWELAEQRLIDKSFIESEINKMSQKEIASLIKTSRARSVLLEKLSDEKLLFELACTSQDANISCFCLDKIMDESLKEKALLSFEMNKRLSNSRISFKNGISDNIWMNVFNKTSDVQMKIRCVGGGGICNPEMLKKIISQSKDAKIIECAFNTLKSGEVSDINDFCVNEIMKMEPEFIESNSEIFVIYYEKISDINTLYKLMNEYLEKRDPKKISKKVFFNEFQLSLKSADCDDAARIIIDHCGPIMWPERFISGFSTEELINICLNSKSPSSQLKAFWIIGKRKDIDLLLDKDTSMNIRMAVEEFNKMRLDLAGYIRFSKEIYEDKSKANSLPFIAGYFISMGNVIPFSYSGIGGTVLAEIDENGLFVPAK